MRHRHNLRPDQESDFTIFSNESATETFNQISAVVTAASFGVCLLSLIVGGIGILNIMLVSVTERTQEIGIRKALGARRLRILGQFATEATVLSLLGGLVGVALGYSVAFLARWGFQLPDRRPGVERRTGPLHVQRRRTGLRHLPRRTGGRPRPGGGDAHRLKAGPPGRWSGQQPLRR